MEETPGKMYALATVLTVLAIVAVLLRLFARRIQHLSLEWNDYMILLALVCEIRTTLPLLFPSR